MPSDKGLLNVSYIDPEDDPGNMWRPSPPLEGSHHPSVKSTKIYEVKQEIWSSPDGSDNPEMSRSQAQSFVQQDWARKQKSRLLTQMAHRTAITIPGPFNITNMETFTVTDTLQSEKNHKQEPTNLKRKLKILMQATNPSDSDSQDPPTTPPQPRKKRRIVSPELGTMPDPNNDDNASEDKSVRKYELKKKLEGVKKVHKARSVRVEGPIVRRINSYDDQPFSSPPTNSKRQGIMSQPSTHVTSRERLANEWSSIAKAAGAACITFTNDVDREMLPKLSRNFQYVETGYHYANNVPRAKDLEDSIFLRCECERCTDPRQCECQLVSDLLDEDGEKRIAYNSKGRFVIDVTPGLLVIECNNYCGCNPSCPNRASQWPRTIPIDIFKTRDRGWGARSLHDVRKGTILGIYTGNLMRRSDAEKLDKDEREYCFDLDGQENPYEDDSSRLQAYTVDARMCGNWTRFINHSCSPNLQVYQVVHNTIPEMNTPFIVFCAMKNIPAEGELTVDYDPCASDVEKPRKKKKGKGKESVPAGSILCKCGEDRCRQWVRVLN